ncbi:unnamed protein product [Closterium sp. Naga37s-1]|nr:unnamed protein product [Closterium sp. Naga37s-1]
MWAVYEALSAREQRKLRSGSRFFLSHLSPSLPAPLSPHLSPRTSLSAPLSPHLSSRTSLHMSTLTSLSPPLLLPTPHYSPPPHHTTRLLPHHLPLFSNSRTPHPPPLPLVPSPPPRPRPHYPLRLTLSSVNQTHGRERGGEGRGGAKEGADVETQKKGEARGPRVEEQGQVLCLVEVLSDGVVRAGRGAVGVGEVEELVWASFVKTH